MIMANPKVLDAMRWAIDYQGMADTILKGQWAVHQAFLPRGFLGAEVDIGSGQQFSWTSARARLAIPMLEAKGLVVGDQEPYSGKIYNAAIKRHVESAHRPYVYIEIRQDLIAGEAGQTEWAERLAILCSRVVLALD